MVSALIFIVFVLIAAALIIIWVNSAYNGYALREMQRFGNASA